MTSVVGDTIGRLQNELQKFLDYSYRYSLFNSYSFRGNYCYNLTVACMYCTQYWRKQLATDSRIIEEYI